jgi:death-on-curing protein
VRSITYLTLDDALHLVRLLVVGPVRDLGLLDSAIARPGSSFEGHDAYSAVEVKAAAMLDSLTKNHPLVDGNKRLGWLATAVFLDLNGYEPNLCDDGAFQLVWDVASRRVELDEIGRRLDLHSVRR